MGKFTCFLEFQTQEETARSSNEIRRQWQQVLPYGVL